MSTNYTIILFMRTKYTFMYCHQRKSFKIDVGIETLCLPHLLASVSVLVLLSYSVFEDKLSKDST